jgi:hypothetical protein
MYASFQLFFICMLVFHLDVCNDCACVFKFFLVFHLDVVKVD